MIESSFWSPSAPSGPPLPALVQFYPPVLREVCVVRTSRVIESSFWLPSGPPSRLSSSSTPLRYGVCVCVVRTSRVIESSFWLPSGPPLPALVQFYPPVLRGVCVVRTSRVIESSFWLPSGPPSRLSSSSTPLCYGGCVLCALRG